MTDNASQLKGLAWIVAGILLAAGFAVGLAPLVRAIPWSWEKKVSQLVGSVTAREVCSANFEKEKLLKQLVTRLYPLDPDDSHFSIDVKIINIPLVNAFAELGGKISVTSGLLEKAESAEEIAGVLAHEIEHVRRRHILEGFIVQLVTIQGIQLIFSADNSVADGKWTNYFLNMGFSRSQEAQADEAALLRLQKAHIDNHGFQNFFERLEESASVPTFLSDHPSNHARYEMAGKFQNKDTKPIMTKEEWKILKAYCQ